MLVYRIEGNSEQKVVKDLIVRNIGCVGKFNGKPDITGKKSLVLQKTFFIEIWVQGYREVLSYLHESDRDAEYGHILSLIKSEQG
ncbi:hypothetical protein D3C75_1062150 [compost metagenome]